MAAVTWSLKASDRRILGRGALPALCVSLAFLHLYVVLSPCVSAAADRPASPAQLQALQNQIAGLQGQLAAKEAQLGALNSKIADIKVKMTGLGALQDIGGGVAGGWNLGENVGMGGGRAALQYQLIAAESQRDALAGEISSLQLQIAQTQATLTYWQNPVGTDLQNERHLLRNLRNQRPTSDDQGQLQWDIENTQRRIKELEELERQFQQSGTGGGQGASGGTSGGQSVQPQGAYATPSSESGTSSGSSAQSPGHPGYGPGPHDTGPSQFPTHQEILQGVQGSIGGKSGGKPGGG